MYSSYPTFHALCSVISENEILLRSKVLSLISSSSSCLKLFLAKDAENDVETYPRIRRKLPKLHVDAQQFVGDGCRNAKASLTYLLSEMI